MSVFNQLPRDEIRKRYTHYGWFLGLVPVYLARPDSDDCAVCERNWVPEWWFSLVLGAYDLFCCIGLVLAPGWEPPGFPTLVGDKIE